MSVTDNPLYPKFIAALDELVTTKERLREAERGKNPAEIRKAKEAYAMAYLAYVEIADQV